ncbi:MAG: 2-amino-4-hydroxy-6-hydroxymethyldihydropteridine diphosphokinase [Rhodocyclaceae bacterium]|nr:2-amino-4-hydroxy-6-hydroxymethyldihydropteridine diphosphokinase [Rhodocyclaceae bacterium]
MTRALPHHSALAILGLGANLGDPISTLESAIESLKANPRTSDWRISPFYRTAPIGSNLAQPDYINAVGACRTDLAPEALMQWLLDIERHFGRDRSQDVAPNAPRTLDLDLLIVDQVTLHSPLLTLPHPRLHQRAFVLRPLVDLLPEVSLPGLGRLDQYLPMVSDQAITRIPD